MALRIGEVSVGAIVSVWLDRNGIVDTVDSGSWVDAIFYAFSNNSNDTDCIIGWANGMNCPKGTIKPDAAVPPGANYTMAADDRLMKLVERSYALHIDSPIRSVVVESKPTGAAYDYLVRKYTIRGYVGSLGPNGSPVSASGLNAANSSTLFNDPSTDWRSWTRKVPGECPCGSGLVRGKTQGTPMNVFACGFHRLDGSGRVISR